MVTDRCPAGPFIDLSAYLEDTICADDFLALRLDVDSSLFLLTSLVAYKLGPRIDVLILDWRRYADPLPLANARHSAAGMLARLDDA